jgi:DNA-binding CsgD family transcriptional regulator
MRCAAKEPDQTDKRILSMVSKGYTYREVSREIYVSVDSIKKRLQTLREYYECKTTVHLVAYCTENSLY